MTDEQISELLHDMIGEYLSDNAMEFKDKVIEKILKEHSDLDRVIVNRIYDDEYKKWSDAYCD